MKNYLIILATLISINVTAQYYTGERVFALKFPSEKSNLDNDTYVQINNSNLDLIVAIEDISSGQVIQHAYIKAEDSYKFTNIPVGSYVCKYMWTDKNGNKNFQKDDSYLVYKKDEVGGYEITMQKSVSGNLSQSKISETDFFN